jgi:3-oxoacyl-[acyl-carrier protein] reductase
MNDRLSGLSRSVAGHRAVITGAASGMGRETARLFADEGVRCVLIDRDGEGLAEVSAEVAAKYGQDAVLVVAGDITDSAVLERAISGAVDAFGGLDIVVNNAGISRFTPTAPATESFSADFAEVVAVNLSAMAALTALAVPLLIESGHGRIVNIASTEALVATGGLSAYAASKAGVTGLTRSLAVELGRLGVTVNCICPGPIETAMTAMIPTDEKQRYARRRVPLRRYGTAEEVAHMVLNLCLPASGYVNGTVICVDGGMTVRHT